MATRELMIFFDYQIEYAESLNEKDLQEFLDLNEDE